MNYEENSSLHADQKEEMMMEQIIKQNMFSRTLFNESKLGAYYTDPVHAAKIGRLFRLQGECCVLEPSFGNAEALKAFLSQCERADEAGSVHTFGVELNRETFEQYKQEIEFPVCADFIGGIRASNRAFTLCFANPPYGVGGDDGSTRLEKLFVERIYQLMKTKGYLVLVVSLTTMNLDEFAKCLLARFKPVAFYRFDDKEFEKYKQVVFIGQKRVSIGLYRKEYEEWMIANPGAPLVDIPYIPKDPATRMEVPVSLESEIELFTTKEFDEAILLHNTSALVPVLKKALQTNAYQSVGLGKPIVPLKKDLLYLSAIAGGGQGLAGNEDRGDLHLQRGQAKPVQIETPEFNDEGEVHSVLVTTRNQITLHVIDNFGTIRELA